MKTKDFRHDIAGLRAVAVLSVLLFHYGVTSMSGGFVGVDVFFVISGYLITKSISDDIGRNGYSLGPLLVRFYNRRIRRIVPALSVVLAVTLIAGWFLLMPGDYATTGESAAYSAIGAGNLYFFWNTGYFDREAELQPLLNMWSLGVEEQFYLVWPILLAAILWIARGRQSVVAGIVAALVIIGLAYSVKTAAVDPTAAFYLPHPRAWELGVGALLAFLPVIKWRAVSELMSVLGLSLIGWSVFTLVGTEASPGWPMVPAVLGSALLVWPRAESWTARLLGLRPFTFIGNISYSLYLIHWPLLVLFRHYANGAAPTWIEATVLGFVSIGLAYLSWRFVEEPVRKSSYGGWQMIGSGLSAAAVMMVAGIVVVQAGGFLNRLPLEARSLASLDEMWRWDCPEQVEIDAPAKSYCAFGAPWETATHRAILWGDSFADHMTPIVDAAIRGRDLSVLLYRDCPPALGGHVQATYVGEPNYPATCTNSRTSAITLLKADPTIDTVILSASWTTISWKVYQDGTLPGDQGLELVKSGLESLISEISQPGRTIIVMADPPLNPGDPVQCVLANLSRFPRRECLAPSTFPLDYFEKTQGDTYAMVRSIEGVKSLFPGKHLCDEAGCRRYLNGEFLYRDAGHIRRNLSEKTKKDYADVIGLTDVLSDTIAQSNRYRQSGETSQMHSIHEAYTRGPFVPSP